MRIMDFIALYCGGPGSGPHAAIGAVLGKHGYTPFNKSGSLYTKGNHGVTVNPAGGWEHTVSRKIGDVHTDDYAGSGTGHASLDAHLRAN